MCLVAGERERPNALIQLQMGNQQGGPNDSARCLGLFGVVGIVLIGLILQRQMLMRRLRCLHCACQRDSNNDCVGSANHLSRSSSSRSPLPLIRDLLLSGGAVPLVQCYAQKN